MIAASCITLLKVAGSQVGLYYILPTSQAPLQLLSWRLSSSRRCEEKEVEVGVEDKVKLVMIVTFGPCPFTGPLICLSPCTVT